MSWFSLLELFLESLPPPSQARRIADFNSNAVPKFGASIQEACLPPPPADFHSGNLTLASAILRERTVELMNLVHKKAHYN